MARFACATTLRSSLLPHCTNWQFQSRRTLILPPDTLASHSVKLNLLSDSDAGIVQVILDRPEAKNAIGKDMLKGLQDALAKKAINLGMELDISSGLELEEECYGTLLTRMIGWKD